MQVLDAKRQLPIYTLTQNNSISETNFRLYNYDGNIPNQSELLIPHRKDHYLFVFIRQAGGTRQWIDMKPYLLKDNTFYFSGPNNVIVKEEFKQLWSTGIAFTNEFLSLPENLPLSKLPLIQNPENVHELFLTDADVLFVEDLIIKIRTEYQQPSEWQQRMLGAYLIVFFTYLSRLYTEQFKAGDSTIEKLLVQKFQDQIDEHFLQLHEVSAYASLLHISAGHLSEVVKIQSGKPAIKHIHDRLILEARRLLFHTDQSLKEIAFNLGFADASYFNRFFKRETNVTPMEYRTNIRKMYH